MVEGVGNTEKVKEGAGGFRRQSVLQLFLLIAILVVLNILSGFVFTRFDLTEDKRFTLSESTRKLVGDLKDVVFVRVYLEGDFSPGFSRLRSATYELLDEMKRYSKGNLEFVFIDPSADPDEKQRNSLYAQLYQKGIQPTTLEERTQEGVKRTYIFPGALVSFANVEESVLLLKSQLGAPPEQMLHNSIQNLEFEFSNAIRKVTNPARPSIGFLEGHGELDTLQVADLAAAIGNSYSLKRVRIDGQLNALKDFKTLVVARPDSAFDEKDKFVIDQFVMKGGRVLWLLDPMSVTMDSLSRRGETMALARDLRLDDMLFRYGARINYDLVQDLMASLIPVVTGTVGNQPKQEFLPWYYFPVMTPKSDHPIVSRLNAIKGQFVSSIDLVQAPGVKGSILLTTSGYSKVLPAPVRVSLGIMQFKPDPKMFPHKEVPVAVLLEGDFTSLYKNRIPPLIAENSEIGFKESTTGGKMVVVSDGDMIRNDVQRGQAQPLGRDRFTGTTFGNKTFLLNVIDYLSEGDELMMSRNKDFKLRLLDPAVMETGQGMWTSVALFVPLIVVLITGLLKFILRKRANSKRLT